jgi:methionyl-tRNA formyltransferase
LKNRLNIKINKKLIIFGGNRLKEDMPATLVINFLKKNKINFLLVTDPIHLNKETKSKKKFKFHLKKNEYISFKKLNIKKILNVIDKNTYGISLNSIWKFPKVIIEKFNGKLFNYHAADLPHFRGAANITWKILQNNLKSISINIHKVEEEFDTGNIVMTKKIFLKKNILPANILDLIAKNENSFLINFIIKLLKNKKISEKKQKGQYFYWPRINSDLDGRINWNWKVKDIELFIKAFSHPYNGSFTFINDIKIRIFDAKVIKSKKFHPYQNGIIFRENQEKIFIANFSGYLEILKKDLKYNKKINSFLGKRLI